MSLKDPEELGHWKRDADEAAFRAVTAELADEFWTPAPEPIEVETTFGVAVVHRVDGIGEPVVLAPGFGSVALMYRPELVAGLGGRPIHLLETIGDVGPSVQTAPIRDAADEAGWVDEVLGGLGLDRAHLVGTSFGAWLVLNAARRLPDRVRSVTGIEPVWARIGLRSAIRGLPVALAALAPGPIRTRAAARLHQPLLADPRTRRYGRLAFTRHVNGHPRPDFLTDEQLGAIDAPALFLLAAASEVSRSEAVAERLGRTLPHAQIDVVPDAGHSLPVEHPELVGRRIGTFLASVERVDESAG